MGEIEKVVNQRRHVKNLQNIVLGTIATAGVLSVALLAPNVLTAFQKLGLIPCSRQKEIIQMTRKRLVKEGYLAYTIGGLLQLTAKGKHRRAQLSAREYGLTKPKRWDGKWRVLIFDISERKKVLREKVRRSLITIGFVRLQDSVWVYPYPCDDLITFLKADFAIGRELLYLVVESMEYDRHLREQFGLKQK